MKISIIIPTFNEAKNIAQLTGYLREHGGNFLKEIIVADGNSEDETVLFALRAGATVVQNEARSRAMQMNLGAKNASGDILYFVHADVIPPKTYAQDILAAISEGYTLGCFRHKFNSCKSALRFTSVLFRKMNINVFGGDQTLFIKQTAFETLNGFNERYVIMEEFDFIDRAKKLYSAIQIKKDALASDRKYNRNSYFKVNVYNILAYAMYRVGVEPVSIKRFYQTIYNYK